MDGVYGVNGSPMFQILSLSIKPKPNINSPDYDQKPWEIYGIVQLTAGQSDKYMLFDESYDSPQKISQLDPNNTLFVYLPGNAPFHSFFPLIKVKIRLWDRVRKCKLVKHSFEVDYTSFSEYDKVQYMDVDVRDRASFCVKYITYHAAVFAEVSLIPQIRNDDGSEQTGEVAISGTIFASCIYNRKDFSIHSHSERECNCVSLFGFPNESEKVNLGKLIKLSTCLLAAPSYSDLVIELNLKANDGEVVSEYVSFSAQMIALDKINVLGPNGLFYQVQVEWVHVAYDKVEPEGEEYASRLEKDLEKKAKLLEAQVSSICVHDESLSLRYIGEDLIEIFSISIGLKEDKTCHIHGTILLADVFKTYVLYDKDPSHMEKFECNKTLSLVGPTRCLASSLVTITVDLKDDDRELCKGFFIWSLINRTRPWLHSRICTIIKGELGYAAVHSAIFLEGVEGNVKAFLSPSTPCDHISISGTLIGEYGDDDYSTFLEREYYRSVFFARFDWESLPFQGHGMKIPIKSSHVDSDSEWISMPLSKSVVSVAKDQSLRIVVNLSLKSEGPKVEAQVLSDNVEFQMGRNTWWRIQSQAYHLYLYVEWNNVIGLPPRKQKSCQPLTSGIQITS